MTSIKTHQQRVLNDKNSWLIKHRLVRQYTPYLVSPGTTMYHCLGVSHPFSGPHKSPEAYGRWCTWRWNCLHTFWHPQSSSQLSCSNRPSSSINGSNILGDVSLCPDAIHFFRISFMLHRSNDDVFALTEFFCYVWCLTMMRIIWGLLEEACNISEMRYGSNENPPGKKVLKALRSKMAVMGGGGENCHLWANFFILFWVH